MVVEEDEKKKPVEGKDGEAQDSGGAGNTYKDITDQQQMALAVNKLQQMKLAIINKVNDLDSDRREHKLVLETFENVPEDRRCFRMIGGVMVERTVKEVKPVIAAHEQAVGKAIEALEKELEAKAKEHAFLAARLQTTGATPKE